MYAILLTFTVGEGYVEGKKWTWSGDWGYSEGMYMVQYSGWIEIATPRRWIKSILKDGFRLYLYPLSYKVSYILLFAKTIHCDRSITNIDNYIHNCEKNGIF